MSINCFNEVIKTLFSAGYTQQLIVRKIILALFQLAGLKQHKIIKYLPDKQSCMQVFFLSGKFGSRSFQFYRQFTVGLILHNDVRVMHT